VSEGSALVTDAPNGPRIKIQRAKKHIHELEAEIAAFLKADPYRVVTEEEANTGDKVWRVRVRKQPPLRWAGIVGDAIHNLRSSLDLLVNQLVRANGAEPSRKTAFPISRTAGDYEAEAPGVVAGVSDAAKRLLDELKPYKGGNDPLWRLHRLDIVDKHRLLLAVGAAHRNIVLPSPAVGGLPAGALGIAFAPADQQFPLEDGAEVFRVAGAARQEGDEHYDDMKFTFEVALNEPGVVEGEAVLHVLQGLADLVRGVLDAFDPLLA
jgi:hypothetical protein